MQETHRPGFILKTSPGSFLRAPPNCGKLLSLIKVLHHSIVFFFFLISSACLFPSALFLYLGQAGGLYQLSIRCLVPTAVAAQSMTQSMCVLVDDPRPGLSPCVQDSTGWEATLQKSWRIPGGMLGKKSNLYASEVWSFNFRRFLSLSCFISLYLLILFIDLSESFNICQSLFY